MKKVIRKNTDRDLGVGKLNGYRILADNIPGLEMVLVDNNLKIQCRLGSESLKQGWGISGEKSADLLKSFTPPIIKILKPLLNIAFEHTPVSREFAFGNQFYSIRLIPFIAKNHTLSCVIIIQNITETKLVEKKLILSKKEAEQANEAKDAFIAKMSHEIRTPLNAITGFTEQLKKTRLNRKQENFLDVVYNSSRHLLSVIEDILVISRIESGEVEVDNVPFRISHVLRSVKELLALKCQEKNLSYSTQTDQASEKVFLGDSSKLMQVLINLVSNAIKFTSEGNVEVSCSLKEVRNNRYTFLFKVSDSGIGIAEKEIPGIFAPFYQVDNSMRRNYSGSGLGLTISKDLIESMGGRLLVESTPGEGSEFSFNLTLEKASDVDQTSFHLKKNETYSTDLGYLSVMFVDDDPVNRMLGKVILEHFNIRPVFASSGKEALKKFRPGVYHLILLDINMPGVSGIDVVNYIRDVEMKKGNGKRTRVLAMTANALKKDLRKYINAGVDSIILKPFSQEALFQKIINVTSDVSVPYVESAPDKFSRESKRDINLGQLQKISRGDNTFIALMLETFITNANDLLSAIEDASARNDYDCLAEAVHRLHPSVEQLGIKKAATLLKKLELQCRNPNSIALNHGLINSVIEEVKTGITNIKIVKTQLQQTGSDNKR